jgi:plasmid maintenance system antidote protein VapI
MARKGESLTEALRRVIAESGMAHIAIARATGVQRASIMRFMHGKQSLRLDAADKLAAYFGLELRPKRKGR